MNEEQDRDNLSSSPDQIKYFLPFKKLQTDNLLCDK